MAQFYAAGFACQEWTRPGDLAPGRQGGPAGQARLVGPDRPVRVGPAGRPGRSASLAPAPVPSATSPRPSRPRRPSARASWLKMSPRLYSTAVILSLLLYYYSILYFTTILHFYLNQIFLVLRNRWPRLVVLSGRAESALKNRRARSGTSGARGGATPPIAYPPPPPPDPGPLCSQTCHLAGLLSQRC